MKYLSAGHCASGHPHLITARPVLMADTYPGPADSRSCRGHILISALCRGAATLQGGRRVKVHSRSTGPMSTLIPILFQLCIKFWIRLFGWMKYANGFQVEAFLHI